MLEQREWVRENYDHLRTALMLEPRGHADMYGALLTEPERPDSRRRRAVHAQRGLQHDVRPRRDRGHDDRARARADRAARRPRRDRARLAGRPDPRARAQFAATRDGTRVERVSFATCRRSSCTPACRFASAAARSAPTWRSAARSTRSSTAKRRAFRSCRSGSPSCAGPAWRSSTRSRRR